MPSRPHASPRSAHQVRTLAAAFATVFALGACSTLSDNSTAARVGDQSLSRADLDELIVAATPGAEADQPVTVPLASAHNLLNTWILTEILRGDLTDAGVTITDDDRNEARAALEASFGAEWALTTPAPLQDLQIEQRAAVTRWSGLEVPAPSEDELRAAYVRGPQASGIACTAHILVASTDDAEAALADLRAGATFAEVAAARSADPGSAANGGVLPCAPTNDFRQTYIPEFVDAALAATIGEPTDPVASQFGYHIIVLRPFEDVRDEGIDQIFVSENVRFGRAAGAADVHVDPRYGAFDPAFGVVTLG